MRDVLPDLDDVTPEWLTDTHAVWTEAYEVVRDMDVRSPLWDSLSFSLLLLS
jgi:hypothetical protein